jgi:hypothetical protein
MTLHAPRTHATRTAPALLLAATLAACGGGGGDDAASTPAPAVITSANSNTVAAQGYEVAKTLFDATSAATAQLKSGDAPGLDLVRFSLAQVQSIVAGKPGVGPSAARDPLAVKATTSQSLQCPSGGSISAISNDQNGNGIPDAGDSATLGFNACSADGTVVSGSMTFVFQSFSSTAAADTARVTVTLSDLRAVSGSQVQTANGDLTLAATIGNVSPFTTVVAVSGTRLAVVDGSVSRTLAGYSGQMTVDDTRRTFAYSVSGVISGSGLPGSLALSTPTPITGSVAGGTSAGVLVVAGAANASVSLIVDGSTGVRVALDSNGDGTPESQQALTWAQLDAL